VTARVSEELRMRPVVGANGDAGEPRPLRTWGWAGVGTGAALGAGAAIAYGLAASAYRDYQMASTESQANALRVTTEQRLLASRVLGGGAVGLAAAGVVMLVVDSRRDSRANMPVSLGLAAVPGGAAVAAAGTW
jgi:hypothetical protein